MRQSHRGLLRVPGSGRVAARQRRNVRNEVGALRRGWQVSDGRLRWKSVQTGLEGEETTLVRAVLRGTDLRQRAHAAAVSRLGRRPSAPAVAYPDWLGKR